MAHAPWATVIAAVVIAPTVVAVIVAVEVAEVTVVVVEEDVIATTAKNQGNASTQAFQVPEHA